MYKKIDANEIVDKKEQLESMVKDFVPSMLQPGVWPGFTGVDLANQEFLRKYFLPDEAPIDHVVLHGIMNFADLYYAARQTPTEDEMNVIFLETGRPWGHTYICLLECVSKIMIMLEEGHEYAYSTDGQSEAILRAFEMSKRILTEEDYLAVIDSAAKTSLDIGRNKK